MEREPIVFVGTSDLSPHFRGKSDLGESEVCRRYAEVF
jgi:hypothetical protein